MRHKKGHIRVDCWLRKKKQSDANITELIGEDEDKCDVLSVNRSIGNKDKCIIDYECSQHISFNSKILSYTSVQKGEVFMENSATSKVISEGTIQFYFHDGCITTLQCIHHIFDPRYNLISLGAVQEEGLNFSFEGDLMEVSKEAHVKF